nr:Nif3-like dinuclear metal center hexameric protein [Candidatus Delongbacteria bacterium]
SGGAPEILNQAIDLGLDLFITGEVAEYSQELCREAQIDYLALGHYNSEKLGVIHLGKKISENLGCETVFIDISNPV